MRHYRTRDARMAHSAGTSAAAGATASSERPHTVSGRLPEFRQPPGDKNGTRVARTSFMRQECNGPDGCGCRTALFRTLFDSVPCGVYELHADGRIAAANATLATILGHADVGELEGRLLSTYDVDPASRDAWLRKVLEQGRANGDKRQLRARDGTVLVVLESAFVTGGQGDDCRIQGSITDITAHTTLEQQVRQSHKLEALGSLAGGIAHDFNNLLTAILGQSELLLDDLPDDGEVTRSVREIQYAAQSAARLTGQLLAFSRRESARPELLDVNAEIERLTAMLRRVIGEDITLHIERGEPVLIRADKTLLEQVVMNLAVNARDAMPNGGSLVIATRAREQGVTVAVSDTGVGMDAATEARIFEPFFTTKGDEGTGLGLATVHTLVSRHGGTIAVKTAAGAGTTFEVSLPAATGERRPEPAAAPPADVRPAPPAARVMLVEDDDAVRQLVGYALRARGCTVIEMANAEDALQYLSGTADACDLLISDVVLPRMDGHTLARSARASAAALPVVLMSGYTHVDLPEDVTFLRKPFTPSELLGAVGHAVAGVPCVR
jgi:two-component system cell cycle sensor histidine kinase/response regulator CckA